MAARGAMDRELPPEQVSGCLHPRETNILLGHDRPARMFEQAIRQNQVHHAWLLEGQKGIGKATFAWHAVKRLLGVPAMAGQGALNFDETSPLNRQIIAKGHPDVLQLSRSWDDKTKKWSGVISVAQARGVGEFFSKKAGEASWRACVLDAVDEMNGNAMNALLKTLEEPPAKGVLFLICHQPGKLPDTIRSRCRRVLMRAPDQVAGLRIVAASAGDVPDDQQKLALALAAGAPGFALEILHQDGLKMWADIQKLFDATIPVESVTDILLTYFAGKADSVRQGMLFLLMIRAQELQAKAMARRGLVDVSGKWATTHRQAKSLISQVHSLNLDPSSCLMQLVADMNHIAQRYGAGDSLVD